MFVVLVVGPVHAPVQAMPAAPTSIVRIVVLTCCGLLIITAVLATVCLVRKRKINRGNVEDDELDIRFLPPDEFLDFTLARPILEETQLCGGSSWQQVSASWDTRHPVLSLLDGQNKRCFSRICGLLVGKETLIYLN